MPSNLAIDDKLLSEALRLGGLRTKRATVDEALREFIAHRKRVRALEGFGRFDFDDTADYDFEQTRRKRR